MTLLETVSPIVLLFAPLVCSRATLNKDGKHVLQKIGDALKAYEDKIIRVVGHTDNVKIVKSLQDASPINLELSEARTIIDSQWRMISNGGADVPDPRQAICLLALSKLPDCYKANIKQ